jgi:hypothetical protein
MYDDENDFELMSIIEGRRLCMLKSLVFKGKLFKTELKDTVMYEH